MNRPVARLPNANRPVVGATSDAPHSVEAEQHVLGALMLESSAWDNVAEVVRSDDFYRSDHRLIFEAEAALARKGKPCDVTTVSEQLECMGQLAEAGGRPYLVTLASDTPTAANARAYAEIVRDRAADRAFIEVGEEIASAAREDRGESRSKALERLEARVVQLRERYPDVLVKQKAIAISPVSTWAAEPPPVPRDWVIEGLIPAGRVTSFLGNGGLGKTTIAAQLAVHVATSRPLFDLNVVGGPVLGVFCEDEENEMKRRIRATCAGEAIDLEQLDRLYPMNRDGQESVLCTFERDQIQMTRFYQELEATVAEVRPRLLIIDTAADVFAGDFMSTPQVRQFIKVCLGGLCVRHGCAVLLIAHPSASAMNSGDGGGFSTAWNNSVRSRLYLRQPKCEESQAAQDRRVLEVRKSNYAANGRTIPLIWQNGCFVPDSDPIDEGARASRATRVSTRLSMAVTGYFQAQVPSGAVVSFGPLCEHLQRTGDLPAGSYETVRKPLQRTLKQLEHEGVIVHSQVPRGYRLVVRAS